MTLFIIGMNHKTAPLALREKIYFTKDQLTIYLQDLLNQGLVKEAVLLSTCNRSELYCETDTIDAVIDWFCAQTTLPQAVLLPVLYQYHDEAAVRHIMRVACGLDSMILGEPQILGQMKEAFSESCTVNAIDTLFYRLFQQVFAIAKDIRTTTAIGACPVSVASAAVHFAKQQMISWETARVVVIGAGDTGKLLLRYLQQSTQPPLEVTVINRHVDSVLPYVHSLNGRVMGFEQLEKSLETADLVFSATGSVMPIIKPSMLSNRDKSLMLIDIAVPRDIDPFVAALPGITLYCLDDLKMAIEKNKQGREHAADKAHEMINKKSRLFMEELTSLDHVTHVIRAYRGQIETICRAELIKAKQKLNKGEDPMQVLDSFAYGFVKKLLHSPSVRLRQAGVEGQLELLHFAKQLFSLADLDIERLS